MAQKLTPHYLMHIDVLMLCSEIGIFLKMAITQKVLVGISSNFLHSMRTSIRIRKCNKNWG